ncbi:hypothetical protein PIROE2DRAFT_14218 [Piromyces sp. E2]|nr:hypothetical protein PIROE2DRAFT_14218 [Piromyces sp. E2]|eukprot:OUM60093.1 hypothetical protein PIROE2DRAFT_14218 [Piromyces sp. E2]
MKNFINLFILVTAFLYSFVISVNATDVKNDNDDKYYMIFVENDYNENSHNKRQEVNESVYELVDEIHNLIMKNTDTYKDPEKLFEIEEENKLRKRNEEVIYLMDHGESDIVYPISSHKDRTIVYAYLSTKLATKVKTYPNVKACIPDQKLKVNSINSIDIIDKEQIEVEVKNETNWKGVSFRENADLHLSLISQGKYNNSIHGIYDTTYYYPSSAGQDIDIYVVDTGFDFRHPEFSNKDEREAKCLYYINFGGILKSPHEEYCYGKQNISHGLMTSDTAAGLIHGVASKANVYGIVINEWTSDLFVVLQYIKDIGFRKNKSVFNFSLGFYLQNEKQKELINYLEGLINSITEEGGIMVVSAGNNYDNIYLEYKNKSYYPCSFKNVICVGAVDTYGFNEELVFPENPTKIMKTQYYRKADFSNYGNRIDIFAPGFSVVEYKNEKKINVQEITVGTSFSSPIVAGIVATLMSENSDIKFNTDSMREYLWELGEKDIIDEIPEGTLNIFINNGKHSIYPGNDEEDSDIEIEVDYDKPLNYYDSNSDSDDESDVNGKEENNENTSGSYEYPSGNYEYPSGNYEYPSGNYEYPSGNYEYPSGNYEYPSGNYEYPSGNYEYPSDYYEYPSSYEYPSNYYEYPSDYVKYSSDYVEPTDYVFQFEPHEWDNDLLKY